MTPEQAEWNLALGSMSYAPAEHAELLTEAEALRMVQVMAERVVNLPRLVPKWVVLHPAVWSKAGLPMDAPVTVTLSDGSKVEAIRGDRNERHLVRVEVLL